MDPTPFFAAAISQILGVAVQLVVDRDAQASYREAMADSGLLVKDDKAEPAADGLYLLPELMEPENLSLRWNRDSDALLAALFSVAFCSALVEDLPERPGLLALLATVGGLLPLVSVAVLLRVPVVAYFQATIFRKYFPISPFAYISGSLSLLAGILVSLAN